MQMQPANVISIYFGNWRNSISCSFPCRESLQQTSGSQIMDNWVLKDSLEMVRFSQGSRQSHRMPFWSRMPERVRDALFWIDLGTIKIIKKTSVQWKCFFGLKKSPSIKSFNQIDDVSSFKNIKIHSLK